jgi:hypothetical protein
MNRESFKMKKQGVFFRVIPTRFRGVSGSEKSVLRVSSLIKSVNPFFRKNSQNRTGRRFFHGGLL